MKKKIAGEQIFKDKLVYVKKNGKVYHVPISLTSKITKKMNHNKETCRIKGCGQHDTTMFHPPVIYKCGGEKKHCERCIVPVGMSNPASYTCWDSCPCHKKEVSACCGKIRDWFYKEKCICGKPFKPVEEKCCEKCTYLIGGLMHGNREVCSNNSCSCHSPKEKWIQKCPRCGGQEFSIPDYICDKCNCPKDENSKPLHKIQCSPKIEKKEGGTSDECKGHISNHVQKFYPNCKLCKESWIEEFEVFFPGMCSAYKLKNIPRGVYDRLKSFIKETLSSDRSRLLHELEEEGNRLKRKEGTRPGQGNMMDMNYNQAIADLLKLIQSKYEI